MGILGGEMIQFDLYCVLMDPNCSKECQPGDQWTSVGLFFTQGESLASSRVHSMGIQHPNMSAYPPQRKNGEVFSQ